MLFQYFRRPSVAACYCISWFVSDMRSNPVFLKRDLRVVFFPLHFPELQICPGCFLDKKRPEFLCSLSFLTRSKSSVLRRSWSSSTTAPSEGPVKLHEGSQVLLTSSNEMGTIRYIGPTDFAPGIWLGLELRSAKGKNDGSVGEKRYFTCKLNHGVLVRPSRVTYRGINGAKLVDDIC